MRSGDSGQNQGRGQGREVETQVRIKDEDEDEKGRLRSEPNQQSCPPPNILLERRADSAVDRHM